MRVLVVGALLLFPRMPLSARHYVGLTAALALPGLLLVLVDRLLRQHDRGADADGPGPADAG